MSFSGFLSRPDVKVRIKPLRPKFPRKIPTSLRIKPRTNQRTIVGAAFDYLLRFELQRRAPHAITEPWVAEQIPGLISSETGSGDGSSSIALRWLDTGSGRYLHAREVAKRARSVVERAKVDHAVYVKLASPNQSERESLAAHAIRLAKLDAVKGIFSRQTSELADALETDPRKFAALGTACTGIPPYPEYEAADPEDVGDLLCLLAIVPFDRLLHDRILFLSPKLSEAGGQADLITGDMLVDLKTTTRDAIQVDQLDQLLGYFLLARHRHQV